MNIYDMKDNISRMQDILKEFDDFVDAVEDSIDEKRDEIDADIVEYGFVEEVTNLIFTLRIEGYSEEHMTDYQRGQWDALQKVKKLWNEALRSGNSIENSLLW